MKDYDVIIVGAGPGGIYSAYELSSLRPELKIGIFESGKPLQQRHCPIDGEKITKCIGCKQCSIMTGFGGAMSLVGLCMSLSARIKHSS